MQIDGIEVKDAKEAETLMIYHLKMAAAYFEVTDDISLPKDAFSHNAMEKWVEAMGGIYKAIGA